MTDSLNTRFLWRCYILGCILLPNLVMSSRYLPTRRSIPTQLERNERLKELFEHILESERDAHLSAANKYADQLNRMQKKSGDLYSMPEHMDPNYEKRTVRDFGDDFDDTDYQERSEYDDTNRKQTYFHHRQPQQQQQQQQPWRIELQNYARSMHRGNRFNHDINPNDDNARKGSLSSSSGIASMTSSPSSSSSNQPRSHALLQKIQNANEHSSGVTNGNSDTNPNFNTDLTNDLDWLASNSDLHSMNNDDYDALYDDVNENKRSSASLASSSSLNRKFDHYRLGGTKQRAAKESSQPKMHLN